MKTTSEAVFETFLSENALPFQRVEEQQTPRPDYLVQIGDLKVLFEVKEIAEDENFTMEPMKVYSRIVGDRNRRSTALYVIEQSARVPTGAPTFY